MMKLKIKYIVFFTFILVISSCIKGSLEIPKDIIPRDKMIQVITEIELTQALVKLKVINQDSLINQQELFNQVYNDFNITEEQFNTSLSYYCGDPIKLEEMYVQVIIQLTERQVEN